MDFDTNKHSVFILRYHLIMCVKSCSKVIDDAVSERLKEIFCYIAPRYNITLEEWYNGFNHVHIMFRAQPNSEISRFINAYKSASSRLIKNEFPDIRKSLWKDPSSGNEVFWAKSFFLFSTGSVTADAITQYIESQGAKRNKKVF